MKINSVKRLSEEHFELNVTYSILFVKDTIICYAYRNSPMHKEYSWRDDCKSVGSGVNKLLNWMNRDNVDFFDNDKGSSEKQQILKEKTEQKRREEEL